MPTKDPHRVLHVMTHLIHGGTEFYVLRVCSALDSEQFATRIAYLGSRADILDHFQSEGLQPIPLRHRGPITSIRTVWRLIRMIKEFKANVVQTHGRTDRLYGQVAALFAGIPVVDTLHSHYAAERYSEIRLRSRGLRRLRLLVEDWVRRRTVKAIICVSDAVVDTWRTKGATRDDGVALVRAVPPPLEFAEYSRTPDATADDGLRASLGVSDRWPVLVNVGRMVPGKNQQALAQLMLKLSHRWPQACLLLVGDGSSRADVEAAVRREGVDHQVVFLGSRDDVSAILSVADAFVSPSLSEGLSLVVVEAVASGLPVLSFDLPSIRPLVVQGVSGYRVATGDIDEFVRMGVELVENLHHLADGAKSVRSEVAPRFDRTELNSSLDEVYSSVRGYS